jgi:hypothetical protein
MNSGSKWFRHFAANAMSGRDRDIFRKYESGSEKAKKRKLREDFYRTQKERWISTFQKRQLRKKRILILCGED